MWFLCSSKMKLLLIVVLLQQYVAVIILSNFNFAPSFLRHTPKGPDKVANRSNVFQYFILLR